MVVSLLHVGSFFSTSVMRDFQLLHALSPLSVHCMDTCTHPTDRFVSKRWFAPKRYGTCTIVPEDMELLRMFAVLRSKSETHAFLNHHIRKCSSSDDDVLTSRG